MTDIFYRWLSIGRLYKDHDLAKLVDLILIAYTKQPVDFVMHHFDVLQVLCLICMHEKDIYPSEVCINAN